MKQCRAGTVLDHELRRLSGEGFVATVIGEQASGLAEHNVTSATEVRVALRKCSSRYWAGFQLHYPMPKREVRACTGFELVQSVTGVFEEVVPAMNACMDVPLTVYSTATATVDLHHAPLDVTRS